MDPSEVVGNGIRNIVTHAHRAGVMVCGAEVIASILECSERGEPLGASNCRNRDRAVRAWQNFEWLIARENQCDLVGYSIHLIPGRTIGVGLHAARELLCAGLRVA